MPIRTRSEAHGILALVTALAACGGGAAEGPAAANPGVTGSPGAAGSSSAAPSSVGSTSPPTGGSPSASPSSAASAGALTPAHVAIELKAPIPTAFAADLKAIGLDPAKLPPMAKLEPKALRSVMKLLAKSLGAKCGDCHQEGDFAAPTPRKKVAAKMWDEFAAKLSFDDGTPLFCDSCHEGRIKQLDRTDKKLLSQWMDANFVVKLKRKDGKDHGCETCHVDMDMTFLVSWSK